MRPPLSTPRLPRDLCCGRLHAFEVAPPRELAPFVAFGWGHRADGLAHRILADGELDLMYVAEERALVLTGPRDRALHAAFSPPVALVGLRLQPGCGPWLLDVEPAALRNRQVLLREVSPAGRVLAAAVEAHADPHRALEALMLGAARRAQSVRTPIADVAGAVHHIGRSAGRVRIPQLRRALGVSERRLERLFHANVGLPAKTWARLVRFQAAVNLARARPELRLGEVAALFEYADQAHFARDARALADATPGELRLTKPPPAPLPL